MRDEVNDHRPALVDGRQPARPAELARLFLALWPGASVRSALLDHQRQWSWPRRSSPVKADRLHLTLHFIGAVERARIAEIAAGLQVPSEPFELSLTRAEIWSRGIAVLGSSEVPAGLRQLHASLGEALRALQLPVEARQLRPHVTLARHAAAAIPPIEAPLLPWPIDSYVLVESTLAADGSYHLLRRYA